jgi:hypothetical protein
VVKNLLKLQLSLLFCEIFRLQKRYSILLIVPLSITFVAEFSRAVRFWTYGYDIYSPHRVYVVHNYHSSQSDPKHFGWYGNREEKEEDRVEHSVFRLKTLFQMPGGDTDPSKILALHQSKYGLGDRRTYDQVIEFSGIDTRHRTILGNRYVATVVLWRVIHCAALSWLTARFADLIPRARTPYFRCGNIDYVPFKEHPWGPDYIPKFDPVSEVYIDARDPDSVYFDGSDDMKRKWREAQMLHEAELELKQKQLVSLNNLKKQEGLNLGHISSAAGGLGTEEHVVDAVVVSPNLSRIPASGDTGRNSGIAAAVKGDNSFYFVFIIVAFFIFSYVYRHSYHVGKDARLSESIPDGLSTVIKTV